MCVYIYIYILKLNNVKNTTKFQVLRLSCKLLYNLQLDNYSFKSERVVEKSSYPAEDWKVIYMKL